MQLSVVLWSVWGLLVVLFVIMKIYVSRLSRDEDDQLVLDDSFEHVKQEQAAIVAQLNKVQPIQTTLLWLLGAMTVFVIVYYIIDMIRQFQ